MSVLRGALCAVLAGGMLTSALAQGEAFSCGTQTPERLAELHQGIPERVRAMREAADELEAFTSDFVERGGGTEIVIPVVFHVIHMNGAENISDAQIHDAVRVLNEDFNRENSDWNTVRPEFLDIVADVGISFRLAGLDPEGNCTNGITRTVSPLTYQGDQQMKDLIIWPRRRYLNIWVSASADGAAGYTYYPSSVNGSWGDSADGIVVLHGYTGSIGTSSPGYSRVLSHEVGHWINLKHTWGDSNEPGAASNCGMDDNVEDTPNTVGWTSCALNSGSCGSPLDNVENYMEYSYCCKMFTNGQKARMLAALNSPISGRNELWTMANRALTGTLEEPGLCAAVFESDVLEICAGGTVVFEDRSYSNVQEWHWTFPGGSPELSSEQHPVVTYPAAGTYPVSLSVGDGTGTVSTSQADYITVLPVAGAPLPFSDDFETSMVPGGNWSTWDGGQDGTFQTSTAAAFSGARSVMLANHGRIPGTVDELITTTLDLSDLTTPPVLSFRYAFRQRNTTNNDQLRVLISRDCGVTWNLRAMLSGQHGLATVPASNPQFTPSGPDQWGYREVTNITASYLESDVRFKFWFRGDGGSNLWLDDVNINGVEVGLEEQVVLDRVTLVPNPADEQASLVMQVSRPGALTVDLLDPRGRLVTVVHNGQMYPGEWRQELPMTGLPAGLYLVRVVQADQVRTLKLSWQGR